MSENSETAFEELDNWFSVAIGTHGGDPDHSDDDESYWQLIRAASPSAFSYWRARRQVRRVRGSATYLPLDERYQELLHRHAQLVNAAELAISAFEAVDPTEKARLRANALPYLYTLLRPGWPGLVVEDEQR